MLEVRYLNVWYGVTEVLRDVSFEVPEGRIVSLLEISVDEAGRVSRIDEAQVIPAGPSPLGHGIQFALVANTVDGHVAPGLRGSSERRPRRFVRIVARLGLEIVHLRQRDGKVLLCHRAHAAIRTV